MNRLLEISCALGTAVVASSVAVAAPASAAVPTVQKDPPLSVPAALDVIRGAVAYLDC